MFTEDLNEPGLAHHLRSVPLSQPTGPVRKLEIITFIADEPVDVSILDGRLPVVLGADSLDPTAPYGVAHTGEGPRLEHGPNGWVFLPTFDMVALLDRELDGEAHRSPVTGETVLKPGERLLVEVGPVVYLIQEVTPGRRVPFAPVHLDTPMLAILTFIGATASIFGYALATVPPPPETSMLEMNRESIAVDLMRIKPPPPSPQAAKMASPGAHKGAEGASRKGQPRPTGRPAPKGGEAMRLMAGMGAVFADIGTSELPGGVTEGVAGLRGRPTGGNGPGLGNRGPGLGGGGQTDSLGFDPNSLANARTIGRPGGEGKPEGRVQTAGEPITIGSLAASEIDRVVKQNLAAIRFCYQKALQSNPSLGGKITVKFTIAGDGSVSSANTRAATPMPTVESCIQGRFQRMQFPAPKGGGVVLVSYPFLFSES